LILISAGFDGAGGDVGNCFHQPNSQVVKGMDLTQDDFAWTTSEILKIADICCQGRVVSVLEGGYGEYESLSEASRKRKSYTTRSSAINKSEINLHSTQATVEIDANAVVCSSISLMLKLHN
jgi:acetoin utilization deacetylase AcuC-like enzyme